MILSHYCKQRIVQHYFERKVSYGRIAKVLAARAAQKDAIITDTFVSSGALFFAFLFFFG